MRSGLQADVCAGRFPVDLMVSAFSHRFTALMESKFSVNGLA